MKSNKIVFCFTLLFLLLGLLFGCEHGVVFDKNKKLPQEKWHYKEKVSFEAEIKDTVNLYKIYVNVRNSVDYKYMNFYMFLNTEFPDGRIVRDTLECILADTRGEWTGKGLGKIRSNSFLMREKVWFPKKGTYTFTFEQAMREDTLEGVTDIGIRIEKM